MTKAIYRQPIIEIMYMENQDIIVTSSGNELPEDEITIPESLKVEP